LIISKTVEISVVPYVAEVNSEMFLSNFESPSLIYL
jgi:hypothetical protein